MKSITKIIQSKNDSRIYRHISLPNQLSCLLISDKDTDKSAASISVGVGSLEDPRTTPGLAHFLEHMLFLGTEKFPNQSEYKAYLMKNSGSLNAYTSSTETVYFFSCSNQAYNGALDRFSQFFIKPLFNSECTQREMQAVHSEHQKNMMNDSWRMMQLIRSSALKHTAYNHFSTGDLTTLQKPNIRDELIEFYKKYYSANLMKLVLYSKENIEEIEKLAYQYFSPIENQSIQPLKYIDMPFTSENLAKFYHVKSIKKGDKLEIVWYVENLRPYFDSNPGSYISFLLGHEGKNSLLSYLIDEGLALELSSGCSNELNLFSTIEVSIKLTKKGLENYKDVSEIVFKYLNILKEKGVQKYLFEEKQYINQLRFDFKEKETPENYVIQMSSDMQIYPKENILNHNYLLKEFQPELIQKVFDQMNFENMRIYLMSETFENLESIEPIYGTQYSEKPLDLDIAKRFKAPNISSNKNRKTLDLPTPNNFLPRNLTQLKNEESQFPLKILETSQTQVFFKQDNKFLTPKANIFVRIYSRNEKFPFDIKSYLSSKIWNEMIYNEIRETIYLAKMAHLNASFSAIPLGLDLHFSGFNDGLLKFIDEISIKLANRQQSFDKEKFQNIYQEFLKEYSDFQKGQPLNIAMHIAKNLIEIGPVYHINDLYENLKVLTFEEFSYHSVNFFKSISFEWLALGNIASEDIKKTALKFESNFNREVLPNSQIPKIQIIEFNSEQSIPYYEFFLSEIKQRNSATLTIFQDKRIYQPYNYLILWVLSDILKEPYFTQLRTNEQLGYIVNVRPSEDRGVCSLQFMVQSERKDPQHLASRIWEFLKNFKDKLLNLEKSEFEKFKKSIIVKILQKNLNIWDEGSDYWVEIIKHKYDFNNKELKAKLVEQIELNEFIEFVNNTIYKEPKVLEIMVVAKNHSKETEKSRDERKNKGAKLMNLERIEDFKKNKKVYEDYYHKKN